MDAMTLANILRTDMHTHRPPPADTELARSIAVLARALQDAIWRRTTASNELSSGYGPTWRSSASDAPPWSPGERSWSTH
jgi:hypothetical protein